MGAEWSVGSASQPTTVKVRRPREYQMKLEMILFEYVQQFELLPLSVNENSGANFCPWNHFLIG